MTGARKTKDENSDFSLSNLINRNKINSTTVKLNILVKSCANIIKNNLNKT